MAHYSGHLRERNYCGQQSDSRADGYPPYSSPDELRASASEGYVDPRVWSGISLILSGHTPEDLEIR